jgi:ABC-type branched-subunit amino acid transport system ATPase component/branched-subunit amino acid ABC-type transport system permease component
MDFLPFLVVGLVSGSVYGLAAMGLVLTYKTSGVFNFAHGAVAAAAALIFYALRTEHHVPWPLAAVISVLVFGTVVGLLFELIARRISSLTAAWQILATVGMVILVEAVADIAYGQTVRPFPGFLPTGTYQLDTVNVGYDQTITFAIGLVAVAALYVVLHRTRTGLAMRAVVDSPDVLALRGISPARTRRSAWILGCGLASASGLLLAPQVNLDARQLVLLVVQAFGAAAIGSFSSLPITYAGGLALGVAGSFSTRYVQDVSWLSGFPASLPFLVLLIVLVVTPKARLTRDSLVPMKAIRESWQAPPRVRIGTGAVILVVLALAPSFVGTKLDAYTAFLIFTILFLSLGLLVKLSGQVSLGHLALAAVGAVTFAHLVADGVPWGVAVVLGGLLAVPVGALVAIPAIRLSGVFLALATLGFAVLLEQLVYPTGLMFGPTQNGLDARQPGIAAFGSPRGFYYLILGFVVLAVLLLTAVQQGRLGRLLRAVAGSRVALETHGLTVTVTLMAVFCISAFVAGIGGALLASFYRFATAGSFSSSGSLLLFTVLLIVVGGAPWYALIAAAAFQLLPSYITIEGVTNYLNLLFGVSAVLAAMSADKAPSVPMAIRRLLGDRQATTMPAPGTAADAPAGVSGPAAPSEPAPADVRKRRRASGDLSVAAEKIVVRFGGLVALDGVSLAIPSGRITGLIGPNGAGKTTLLNVLSGLQKADGGAVLLDGEDVTRTSAASRARKGMGRTFQRVQLWESLTVEDNVRTGVEAYLAGGQLMSQLAARPGDGRTVRAAAAAALELAGISELRAEPVRNLSTGQRRLVELARSLACPFDVLLLDEPSSGLDPSETQEFGRALVRVVAERGTGILLVEHDMSLVMSICDYVHVIDFGRPLFDGTPDAVAASDVVRAAYLGAAEPDTALDPRLVTDA